jgi:hypothetical protein
MTTRRGLFGLVASAFAGASCAKLEHRRRSRYLKHLKKHAPPHRGDSRAWLNINPNPNPRPRA